MFGLGATLTAFTRSHEPPWCGSGAMRRHGPAMGDGQRHEEKARKVPQDLSSKVYRRNEAFEGKVWGDEGAGCGEPDTNERMDKHTTARLSRPWPPKRSLSSHTHTPRRLLRGGGLPPSPLGRHQPSSARQHEAFRRQEAGYSRLLPRAGREPIAQPNLGLRLEKKCPACPARVRRGHLLQCPPPPPPPSPPSFVIRHPPSAMLPLPLEYKYHAGACPSQGGARLLPAGVPAGVQATGCPPRPEDEDNN